MKSWINLHSINSAPSKSTSLVILLHVYVTRERLYTKYCRVNQDQSCDITNHIWPLLRHQFSIKRQEFFSIKQCLFWKITYLAKIWDPSKAQVKIVALGEVPGGKKSLFKNPKKINCFLHYNFKDDLPFLQARILLILL